MTRHDAFFKRAMQIKEIAVTMLSRYLDAKLVAKLNMDGLRLEHGSIVDGQLSRGEPDLLFSIPHKTGARRVWVLVEHQSGPDRLMPLRRVRYLVELWTKLQNDKPGIPLTPIYTLIFYNGTAPWKLPLKLADLFPPEAGMDMAAQLIEPLPIVDMVREELPTAPASQKARVFHHLMKHIRDADITPALLEILPEMIHIDKDGSDFVAQCFKYILHNAESKDHGQILEMFQAQFSQRTGGDSMTIADCLIQEGEKIGLLKGEKKGEIKGYQRGRMESLREVALGLMLKGVDLDLISETTGLSSEEILALQKQAND